jgi:hypothetical protein
MKHRLCLETTRSFVQRIWCHWRFRRVGLDPSVKVYMCACLDV